MKETRSYYGPSMALLRLAILPPLPCFRLSGHGRPQLYADAYNSGLLALYCFPPGLYHYLLYSSYLPIPIPVPSLPPLGPDPFMRRLDRIAFSVVSP